MVTNFTIFNNKRIITLTFGVDAFMVPVETLYQLSDISSIPRRNLPEIDSVGM